MKGYIFTCFIVLCCFVTSIAQPASNFNCNDCSGTNRNLFNDLDAGKVVVIVWVMPCASCINGALSAQTEVQNALAANPGKVLYYLSDDDGNTNCTTLTSWASTNGITSAMVISNSQVNMSAYGAAGMPKIVVVGGGSARTIFYNQNAPNITANGIKDAITAALAATPTGIKESQKSGFSVGVYPNPSNTTCKIAVNLTAGSKIKIEICNTLGQVVRDVFAGSLEAGNHSYEINTSALSNGNYFVKFSDEINVVQEKFIVNH